MFSFLVEVSICLFFFLLMVLGPNPRLHVCQVSALPLNCVPFLLIPQTSLYIVDVSPLLDICVVNIILQVCICAFLPAFLSFSFFLGEHGVLAHVCHMEARGHCQESFSIAFPFVFGDRFSCLTCNSLFQMDWLPSKPMGFIFFQIWPFKLELNTQPLPLAFYVGTREPDSDRSSYKHSRYCTTEPSPSLNFYSINLLIYKSFKHKF